ncbi:fimbria/pilus outer membrane usher protein [Paraherbaspirillum soli]|uniref:Fimbria/pilus outer membrane usher protein n=1 Tax=Paraherbaspirillum soli TaxID=631222 RepID=A0ABW0MBT5_9BURK
MNPTPPLPCSYLLCTASFGLALLCADGAHAAAQTSGSSEIKFNSGFLEKGSPDQNVDLSIFAQGNRVLPGDYVVDVNLNGSRKEKRTIRFDQSGGNDAQPCVTLAMWQQWGLNLKAFPDLEKLPAEQCMDGPSLGIPEAKVAYDASKQQLDVSLPQAAMQRDARGWTDPAQWDQGINALMLNYNLGTTQYRNNAIDSSDSTYLNLRGGVNLGAWRLRSSGNYSRGTRSGGAWQRNDSYLQRDLIPWNSSIVVGDSNTPGNIFDSFAFRGVQLSSDDSMLPDSLRGYAPTIRGIAQNNATVTVHQNGFLLYTTYVGTGPFEIDDLYATAGSGDLEVTVTEADGRKTRFVQPYAAVPTLQREGQWSYSLTAGKYRSAYAQGKRPAFAQASAARGIGRGYTLYGGLMGGDTYQSLVLGAGANWGDYGAASVDLSHAQSRRQDGQGSNAGQSLRFLYAKSLVETSTDLHLLGYRYSTPGYRTFSESVSEQNTAAGGSFFNRRSRIEGSLQQKLGDYASLFASVARQNYWGTSRSEHSLQIGLNSAYRNLLYGLFYSSTSGGWMGGSNRQLMLTLSIPLDDGSNGVSYSAARSDSSATSHNATLYGSALQDKALSYSLSANHFSQSNGNASLSYLAPSGRYNLARSQGRGHSSTSASMSGGLLAHADGLTLAQELGDTIALVQTPGVAGVSVASANGVRTDRAGNAVVTSLTPYRSNRVAMDPTTLPEGADLKNTVAFVIPTKGAVVRTTFAATTGGVRMLLRLLDKDGKALPFGSRIENAQSEEQSIVGSAGETFLASARPGEILSAHWGKEAHQSCSFRVDVQIELRTHSRVGEAANALDRREVVCL